MEQEHWLEGSVEEFRAACKEFDTVYSVFAKNCGLSDAEFWSLLMLRSGFTTQSEISSQLLVSRQTVNSAFKLLVKKGLVSLEPLEHNQRTKRASLTEYGEQFAQQHIDRIVEAERQAWLELEEPDRIMLTQLTRKYCILIQAVLERSPAIKPSSSEYLSPQ